MKDNMYSITITIIAPSKESAKQIVIENIDELINEAEVEQVD